MTKTLTKQYKNKELSGWYYVKAKDGSINHWLLFTDSIEFDKDGDVEEVLAPVPSYEDWHKVKDLGLRPDYTDHIEKWEDCARLTKKLEIATKALKETKENLLHVELSGLDGDNRQKMYDLMFEDGVIDKALKEMEGVK